MSSYRITGTTLGEGAHLHQGDIHNTYTSLPAEERPKTIYDVPDLLSPHFIGRDAETRRIHEAFSDTSGRYPRRCVIHGTPGLGKTQLALNYAKYAREELGCPYIFWVSATASDRLLKGLSKLSETLALPGHGSLDQSAQAFAVRTWLENSTSQEPRKWLLILDNATEDVVSAIREALPRQNAHGSILITTRTSVVSEAISASLDEGHVQLALEVLEDSASVTLLQKASGRSQRDLGADDVAAAKAVVSSVGYLPLAVQQAGSLINVSSCSFAEVRDIYKSDRIEEALEQEIPLSHYEKSSVMAIYDLTIRELEHDSKITANILRLLILMDPESISIDILREGLAILQQQLSQDQGTSHLPEELSSLTYTTLDDIQDICTTFSNVLKLSKTLKQLQMLSLISQYRDGDARAIRFHDLTQLILRMKLMSCKNVQKDWLRFSGAIIEAAFEARRPRVGEFVISEAWTRLDAFISHIRAFWKHAGVSNMDHRWLWILSAEVGMDLAILGRDAEARDFLQSALSQQTLWLGEEHEETLKSAFALAHTLVDLRNLHDARRLSAQLFQTCERIHGSEHVWTRRAMIQLGRAYSGLDQNEEARAILERAIGIQLYVKGPDNELTLMCMESLIPVYRDLKQFETAEGFANSLIKKVKRLKGPEYHFIITVTQSLASVYGWQEDWSKAVMLLEELLPLIRKIHGEDSAQALHGQLQIGVVHWKMGRLEDAAQWLETSTLKQSQIYGLDHSNTLRGWQFLALTYGDQCRWEQAVAAATKVLERRTILFGSEDSRTVQSQELLDRIVEKKERAQHKHEKDNDEEEATDTESNLFQSI